MLAFTQSLSALALWERGYFRRHQKHTRTVPTTGNRVSEYVPNEYQIDSRFAHLADQIWYGFGAQTIFGKYAGRVGVVCSIQILVGDC